MENGKIPLKFLKIFSYNKFFYILLGSIARLHEFFIWINNMHPTINFTMTHTPPELYKDQPESCDCPKIQAIPFLDTLCRAKDGKISTDMYRKPSDRNQYLLPNICPPSDCTKSIPYSVSTRIVRICSEIPERYAIFVELKEMLLERKCTPGIVDAAISKAKEIPRNQALRSILRQPTKNRPVFVVSFDPACPPS